MLRKFTRITSKEAAMNLTMMSRTITLVFTIFAITACATTKPGREWRNEQFSGQLDNILIIGVTSRPTRRRLFEDKFVEALAAHGIGAVPGYSLLSSSLHLSREVVEQAIAGQDLGAVLVTRLVGVKQKEVYRLPTDYAYHRSYDSFYDNALQETNRGYYEKYKILALETNLYDTASGELVWSMQSEMIDASQPRQMIEGQIELTINTLVRRGLVAAKP